MNPAPRPGTEELQVVEKQPWKRWRAHWDARGEDSFRRMCARRGSLLIPDRQIGYIALHNYPVNSFRRPSAGGGHRLRHPQPGAPLPSCRRNLHQCHLCRYARSWRAIPRESQGCAHGISGHRQRNGRPAPNSRILRKRRRFAGLSTAGVRDMLPSVRLLCLFTEAEDAGAGGKIKFECFVLIFRELRIIFGKDLE